MASQMLDSYIHEESLSVLRTQEHENLPFLGNVEKVIIAQNSLIRLEIGDCLPTGCFLSLFVFTRSANHRSVASACINRLRIVVTRIYSLNLSFASWHPSSILLLF